MAVNKTLVWRQDCVPSAGDGIMDVYHWHYGVLYDCVIVSSWQCCFVLLRSCMRGNIYQLKVFSLKASSKRNNKIDPFFACGWG